MSDEYTPEREVVEIEFARHEPVLSMRDGHIAGCQCMDRVFYSKTEDWGAHLADVHASLLAEHDREVTARAVDTFEDLYFGGAGQTREWVAKIARERLGLPPRLHND